MRTAAAVIFIAALLRCWFVWEVPLHYDELSAVFRASAPDWQTHISKGVIPDGHPAGLQTIIWIWIKLTGITPGAFHLFAAFCGSLSVWLIYLAAENLIGRKAAITTTIFYGLSYLPLIWSQQLRPYAPGMAAASALILIWSRLITDENGRPVRFVYFALLAALCAQLHYFAGFSACLLWLTGLIHSGKQRKRWWLTTAGILLLSLPGLNIFIQQLKTGGLDWLGKPEPDFILRHVFLLLNRQWTLVWLAAGGLLLFWLNRKQQNTGNRILLMLFLFLTPALIGFVWSMLRKPVLQDNVLLFSAPFFYMALSVCMERISAVPQWIIITAAMGFGLYQSQHFTTGMKDGYAELAREIRKQDEQIGMYLTQYADGPVDVLKYHLGKDAFNGTVIFTGLMNEPFSPTAFWKIASGSLGRPLAFRLALNSGSHPLIIPLTEHWTGHELKRQSWIGAEYLSPDPAGDSIYYKSFICGEKGTDIPINFLNPGPYDVVVIRVADTSINPDCELTGLMRNGNEQIDWRSSRARDFRQAGDGSTFLVIKLADVPQVSAKTILHVKLLLKDQAIGTTIQVRVSKGNPYLYGVVCP